MPKSDHVSVPTTKAEVLAVAAALDLPIWDACLPGVLANLDLLARHAAVLADAGGSRAA